MDAFVVMQTTSAPSTVSPNYGTLHGRGLFSATEAIVVMPIPHQMTLSKFRMDLRSTPGGGTKGWQVQLRVNGATDSNISMTCSGSAQSATYTANTRTVNPGDKVCWIITPLNAPSTTNFGISICCVQTAAVGGRYAEFFSGGNTQISATNFYPPSSAGTNSTEASVFAPLPFNATIKNLYVICDADPNPGNWTVTFRSGQNNVGSLSVTIPSGTAAGTVLSDDFGTTGHSYTTAAPGENISLRMTAAATPATSRFSGSYTIEPATDGDYAFLSAHGSNANTSLAYGYIAGSATGGWSGATEEIATTQVVLWQCVLKDIYLKTNAAAGSGNNYTCTVRQKVGAAGTPADTAMVGTVLGTTTSGSATGFNVAFADGDFIDASMSPSSAFTGKNVHVGIRLVLGAGTVTYSKNIGAISAGVGAVARVQPQILRPQSIVSGTWRSSDGTPAKVSEINEVTIDDSTYLASDYHPVNHTQRVRLSGGNTPLPGNPTLRVRYKKDVVPGIEGMDLTVKLYSAGTLITTRTYTGIGTVVEDDYTLTSGETAAITDYNSIDVEMIANHQ